MNRGRCMYEYTSFILLRENSGYTFGFRLNILGYWLGSGSGLLILVGPELDANSAQPLWIKALIKIKKKWKISRV